MRNIPLLFLPLVLAGCEPPSLGDTQPPLLVDTTVSDTGRELALEFDKPVAEAKTGGNFSTTEPTVEGNRVKVSLPSDLKPGQDYLWTAEVKDAGRNLTSVTGRFYGPNDHPAGLRLNEVRIAGSGDHTDLVELRVESEGSLGGWTLDAYSGPETRLRYVFPDREVSKGELVVLHYKPTGDPSEKDETTSADASGGSEADSKAWDFWLPGGKGLSAVKGLIALRKTPDGPPVDALLYSHKPGEGVPLASAAGWAGREELSPDGCTATRTWCRTDDPLPVWIVTANGGATPGKPNKLTAWTGPTSTRKIPPKTKGRPSRPRKNGRDPRRRPFPGSRPSEGGAATRRSRPWSRDESEEFRTGTHRVSLQNPRPRERVLPLRTASSRGTRGRRAPVPGRHNRDAEEGPPLRSGRSETPLPPET